MGDNPVALKRRYDELVRAIPVKGEIFLPTDKIPLDQAVAGLERVSRLYERRLDTIHRPRLRDLRRHWWGTRRCFVIGNGPSLNDTDLSLLAGEATFAVNGFFLKARELTWSPTFYVVEDHLVAEDRADDINAIGDSIKLFPANLAYCLTEDHQTTYFDLRPRISYPHGFDFSMDADRCTYAGCTVTFTCLQLAAFLGFQEIYLIGVDADYAIPDDASRSTVYGVPILDMKSDDPNHFDPNYFGKGYRWHDPQVDKMLEAYREAKAVTERHGISILNAGIGGKLAVFPRVEYLSLFDPAPAPGADEAVCQAQAGDQTAGCASKPLRRPRVAIIDLTLLGDGTATGELKANLLGHWPESRLLHVYGAGSDLIGVRGSIVGKDVSGVGFSVEEVVTLLWEFDPECVIYRPVPENPYLHSVAMSYLRRSATPLVTWIMDDWPKRLWMEGDDRCGRLDADFRWLLERSSERLAISELMAEAFLARYEVSFTPVANGIDTADWPLPEPAYRNELVVRYAGALAENMVFDSVLRVARAVEALTHKGIKVRFEVNTRPMWAAPFRQAVSGLRSCRVATADLSSSEYRQFLQGADILLVAYNFDDQSRAYTGYSVANKLPECLASGRPLLVHGPSDVATVAIARRLIPASVVDVPEQDVVEEWLEECLASATKRSDLAAQARQAAEQEFRLGDRRLTLHEAVFKAADGPGTGIIRYHERSESAHIDEAAMVASLFADMPQGDRVMIDVGAHHGSSLRPFALMGWSVLAFEPDNANRSILESRTSSWANVMVDSRAVSDKSSESMPFYASDVSHGISGLLSFHESHRYVGEVEVTSLAEVAKEHNLDHVDFLKIDVEGFEFSVLRGMPWNRVTPAVVLCEFEDAKTRHLGNTWRVIADYLMERGYAVYVSEWYPIERYGVRHQWRSLRRYPCELWEEGGWGNLIGFQGKPRIEQLAFAVNQVSPPQSVEPRSKLRRLMTRREMHRIYARIVEHIKHRNGLLFQVGRVGAWAIRSLVRRPRRAVTLVLAPLVIMIAVTMVTSSAVLRLGSLLIFVVGFGTFAWCLVGDFRKFKLSEEEA
jgi:FkbM family methyltransferase